MIDAQSPSDGVHGQPTGGVRQQAPTSFGQRQESFGVAAVGDVAQELDGRVGDLRGGGADRGDETHDPVRRIAGGEEVDRELEQRGAGDAPTTGTAVLDHPGAGEVVEPPGNELGQQSGQLVEIGRGTGFVHVDQLVRVETEHLAQIATVAPRGKQVADPRQGVAPALQPADELEAAEVTAAIHTHPTPLLGRREHAQRLVLANCSDGHVRSAGQRVDAHLFRLGDRHGSTVTAFTVTVNSVTISQDDIARALHTNWPRAEVIDEPTPVTGGEWATMFRIRVTGTPANVPEDLVLRLAPHPEMAAKEIAVQRAAASGGVTTPAIHLHGPAGGPLVEAWAVMDFVRGTPLLANLDGVAALPRLPGIARRLPADLAASMATIHRLDPDPVVSAVRAAAPTTALTVDELLPHLRAGAATADRADLLDALDRLLEVRPDEESPVLCHGDLHPLNLLVDGDRVTVLDWTGAVVAPAAYDVAWTWLLLRYPPLTVPTALRPIVDRIGALLAGRFLRSYGTADAGRSLDDLDWYQALHGCRVLIDLALWEATGDPRAETHPARLMAPGATQLIARVTRSTLTT